MTDLTLETLRAELAPMSSQLADLQTRVGELNPQFGELKTQLGDLKTQFGELKTQFGELKTQFGELRTQFGGLRTQLGELRTQLGELEAKVAPMRAQLDGLPLINRSLTVLQQETRALKGAFNDFARTNVTAGEIEALHSDVNRVQAENAELETRLATVERLLDEMQKREPASR